MIEIDCKGDLGLVIPLIRRDIVPRIYLLVWQCGIMLLLLPNVIINSSGNLLDRHYLRTDTNNSFFSNQLEFSTNYVFIISTTVVPIAIRDKWEAEIFAFFGRSTQIHYLAGICKIALYIYFGVTIRAPWYMIEKL